MKRRNNALARTAVLRSIRSVGLGPEQTGNISFNPYLNMELKRMSEVIYNMPLERAIREFTMAELVKLFGKSHPAFLAGAVKAKLAMGE